MYYNDGANGVCQVLQQLGITPGKFTMSASKIIDARRIINMQRKSKENVKKRRKKLRAVKKGFDDANTEKEGNVYETGAH